MLTVSSSSWFFFCGLRVPPSFDGKRFRLELFKTDAWILELKSQWSTCIARLWIPRTRLIFWLMTAGPVFCVFMHITRGRSSTGITESDRGCVECPCLSAFWQWSLIMLCLVQTGDQWGAADSDLTDARQKPRQQNHHPRDQGNVDREPLSDVATHESFVLRAENFLITGIFIVGSVVILNLIGSEDLDITVLPAH